MKTTTRKYLLLVWMAHSWFFCSCVCAEENGLVGYWRFDERKGNIVHDSSGLNNQGTVNNAVWGNGKSGTALSFDGEKSWVSVPRADSLLPKNNHVSITLWFCPEGTGSGLQHLVAKWGNYYLRLMSPCDLSFVVFNEKGMECGCRAYFKFQKRVWYFLAATYDGQSFAIYVDGALVASQFCPVKLNLDNSRDLHFGSASWGAAEFFDGRIDEIKIYNRVLIQEEILKMGGHTITTKWIVATKNEMPSTIDHLRKVQVLAQGGSDKNLAECRRELDKVNQIISKGRPLSAEQAISLYRENKDISKQIDDLTDKVRINILFEQD
jgi:hypothetical protein